MSVRMAVPSDILPGRRSRCGYGERARAGVPFPSSASVHSQTTCLVRNRPLFSPHGGQTPSSGLFPSNGEVFRPFLEKGNVMTQERTRGKKPVVAKREFWKFQMEQRPGETREIGPAPSEKSCRRSETKRGIVLSIVTITYTRRTEGRIGSGKRPVRSARAGT